MIFRFNFPSTDRLGLDLSVASMGFSLRAVNAKTGEKITDAETKFSVAANPGAAIFQSGTVFSKGVPIFTENYLWLTNWIYQVYNCLRPMRNINASLIFLANKGPCLCQRCFGRVRILCNRYNTNCAFPKNQTICFTLQIPNLQMTRQIRKQYNADN